MALSINTSATGGGSFEIIPIVKYDCRSGRMFKRDRANGENVQTDITKSFKAVFDFENVEVGPINFNTGTAPDFHVVRLGETIPTPPSPDHKQGVRLLIQLSKELGGDVRELASTARAFLGGVDSLHNEYLAGAKANPGKLPVVSLEDSIPITTGEGAKKSTNYSPSFKIVGWIPRPATLVWSPKSPARPAAAAPATPPATGSQRVQNGLEEALADDDDFG